MSAEAFSRKPTDFAKAKSVGGSGLSLTRTEAVARIKLAKRDLVSTYAKPRDARGLWESSVTLIPLAGLWVMLALGADEYWYLPALLVIPISLLMLRSFSLLHDCGHGSLFRSRGLNRVFGFTFGVVSGMPQYVWSQHHQYHHTTNGNWSRYRGPLAILSVAEYGQLTNEQKQRYVSQRQFWLAPLAGLLYLVVQPRLTWLRGTADLLRYVIREAYVQDDVPLSQIARQFRTRHWKDAAEYRHMLMNNLVLLGLWAIGCWALGPVVFIGTYLATAALAGAAGLVLFTVQHNFEGSYAGDDHDWDYDEAALFGSSFLVLPAWLNWCTANIGYHHVHHLSARIPCYRLQDCHRAYESLFEGVPRLTLWDIQRSLEFLLWDPTQRRLLTVAQHDSSTHIALEPRI